MKILFLHKYDSQAAAYRYRFDQYFAFLNQLKWKVSAQSLLEGTYLTDKFQNRPLNFLSLFRSYAKRFLFLWKLKPADLVVIYMEVFPFLPFFIEYLLILRKTPYVVDLDDAIFLNYKNHRNPLVRAILGKKFDHIFTNASAVFAGNSYLQSYAKKFNRNVYIIPTVVDMAYYHQEKIPGSPDKPLIIGWVGSPSTAKNLLSISEALATVAQRHCVEFFFVGTGALPLFIPNLKLSDWTREGEIADILKMDIGIMPLEDTAWNMGKCGFKLIQFMACGIPVVGSPIGVNRQIIDHGSNGYSASTTEDWVAALTSLIESRDARVRLGKNGRAKIVNHYSLTFATPLVVNALKTVITRRTSI